MALKNCINCGKEYSDTVEQCPHCQYKSVIFICPECGRFCGKDDKFCMYCGVQLRSANKIDAPKEKILEELQSIANRLKDDIPKDEQRIVLRNLNLFEAAGENTELVTECKRILQDKEERLQRTEEYNKICESFDSLDTSKSCKECIEKLQGFSDLLDVEEMVLKFFEKYKELLYEETIVSIEKSKNLKDWKKNEEIFEELGEFKDSVQQRELCRKKVEELSVKNSAMKKKASIAVVVAILVVVGFVLAKPVVTYSSATKAFENKNYEKAITLYEGLGDYKDSAEMLVLATKADNYVKGKDAFDNKEYENAVDYFIVATDYENTQELLYKTGKALLENDKSTSAVEAFKNCTFENSDEYALYAEGKSQFVKGNYSDASNKFKELGDFEDSKSLKNASDLMLAEEYIKDGYLNKAKNLYQNLPSGFEYNGVKADSRKNTFDKYASVVALCGKWKGSGECTAEVFQIYKRTGSWDSWTSTYNDPKYDYLEIKGYINNDGTIRLKGSADYTVHTDYSSISAYLKPKSKTSRFDLTMKAPFNNTWVAQDVHLTKTGNKIKLDYNFLDTSYSISFNYRYKSTWYYSLAEQY